jgi:hypothetical protein
MHNIALASTIFGIITPRGKMMVHAPTHCKFLHLFQNKGVSRLELPRHSNDHVERTRQCTLIHFENRPPFRLALLTHFRNPVRV